MRILILTSTFPDDAESWRGIFVKEQVDALSKEHSVCVVQCEVDYTRFKPFFHTKVRQDNEFHYPVYRIKVCKSFPVYNQFNYLVAAFSRLRGIVSQHKPDIVHCHYSYPSGFLALMVKQFYTIPYVVTEHSRIKATFRSFFHRKLSLMAMRKAFRVIAVSNALKEEIIAEGINHVDVIPNVTDTSKFSLSNGGQVPFVIGFLGSLNTTNKGLDTLLYACSHLPFSYKLKIGGAGKNFDYYKDLSVKLGVKEKCTFCGNIPQPQIPAFYSDLSVFVLASKYETFGIVLVEAMASGLPVVATSCGGPADIVNDSNGILVEVGNADQMKEALININNGYSNYNKLQIKEYATTNFSSIPFMEKSNNLYRLCLLK